MKKRLLTLFVLLLTFSILIAGCQGGTTTATTKGATPTGGTTAAGATTGTNGPPSPRHTSSGATSRAARVMDWRRYATTATACGAMAAAGPR